MDILRKKLQPSKDDELFKKTHPVLLDLFSMGIREAKPGNILLGSALMLLYAPISIITSIAFKFPYYLVLAAFWFLFSEDLQQFGVGIGLYAGISIMAVNFKDIVTEVGLALAHVFNITTFGHALKWLCSSYLSGGYFSEMLLASEKMSVPITSFIAVVPKNYGRKYDQLIELYISASQTGNETELLEAISEHQNRGASV